MLRTMYKRCLEMLEYFHVHELYRYIDETWKKKWYDH